MTGHSTVQLYGLTEGFHNLKTKIVYISMLQHNSDGIIMMTRLFFNIDLNPALVLWH